MRQSGSEEDSSSSSEEIKIDIEEEGNESDTKLMNEAENQMINIVKEEKGDHFTNIFLNYFMINLNSGWL